VLVVDTRPQQDFKNGHVKGAINIQDGDKFETWLGSIINPGETFYLIAADAESMDILIKKAAKIGYEKNIKAALLAPASGIEKSPGLDEAADYKFNPDSYTIVDVRNRGEISEGKIFGDSMAVPLSELRHRLNEIPVNKPIIVHCAGGYRSAAGASIIAGNISSVPVYDMGEAVLELGS
jgi:hydroxyacylglutathione hydrolase